MDGSYIIIIIVIIGIKMVGGMCLLVLVKLKIFPDGKEFCSDVVGFYMRPNYCNNWGGKGGGGGGGAKSIFKSISRY